MRIMPTIIYHGLYSLSYVITSSRDLSNDLNSKEWHFQKIWSKISPRPAPEDVRELNIQQTASNFTQLLLDMPF